MTQLALDSGPKSGETLICRLTPSGHIDVQPGAPEDGPFLTPKAAQQIIEAFNDGHGGKGVLHLGAAELLTDLPPSLSYWRDVGRGFVGRVCGAFDPTDPKSLVVPDPDPDEITALAQLKASWSRTMPREELTEFCARMTQKRKRSHQNRGIQPPKTQYPRAARPRGPTSPVPRFGRSCSP